MVPNSATHHVFFDLPQNGTVDEDEYNYDEDEFDDYDDDFEDEDEIFDGTNDDENDKTDDETFEKEAEDDVITRESNSSSPDEKMMPQQSMLHMTLSVNRLIFMILYISVSMPNKFLNENSIKLKKYYPSCAIV